MPRQSYARSRSGQKSPNKSSVGRVILITAGMLISALIGYAIGYFLDTGNPVWMVAHDEAHDNNQDLLTQVNNLREQVQDMKAELSKQKQELKKHPTEVGELTFYHELRKQSVTPEPVAETKVSPQKKERKAPISQIISKNLQQKRQKKPVKRAVRYHLQVASFRAESDAVKLKERLLKWGLMAFVKKANVPGYGWRHRVYTGPYADRKGVDKANLLVVKKLHRMGLILRVE